MHPFFAGAAAHFWNGISPEQKPEEIREINSDSPGQSVPAPDAGINVEDLVLPISRVSLELDLGNPCKAQGGKELLGGCGDLRLIHRFHISAELTEIPRKLTRSSRDNRGKRAAILAKSGVRKLRFAASRNNLLDDPIACGEERTRLVVSAKQGVSVLSKPGLGSGQRAWLSAQRGLQDDRKRTVEGLQILAAIRAGGPRLADGKFAS